MNGDKTDTCLKEIEPHILKLLGDPLQTQYTDYPILCVLLLGVTQSNEKIIFAQAKSLMFYNVQTTY